MRTAGTTPPPPYKAARSAPMFVEVKPLTLVGTLKPLTFRLWDEQSKKLISFRRLRQAG
jgi:hypothetical protein